MMNTLKQELLIGSQAANLGLILMSLAFELYYHSVVYVTEQNFASKNEREQFRFLPLYYEEAMNNTSYE